jgi:DNA-binding response OmpR family regulator
MRVLIVESNPNLGRIWSRHLARMGCDVLQVSGQVDAIDALEQQDYSAIVLNLVLEGESAFAVADYASYKRPHAKVVFVTDTTFFSDGSIFALVPNACAFVRQQTPPDDLAAIVTHYAGTDETAR